MRPPSPPILSPQIVPKSTSSSCATTPSSSPNESPIESPPPTPIETAALKALGEYLVDSEDRDQPTESTEEGGTDAYTNSMAELEGTSMKIDTRGAAMSPSNGEEADTPRFAAFMDFIAGSPTAAATDATTQESSNHESSPAAEASTKSTTSVVQQQQQEEGSTNNTKPTPLQSHPSFQYNYSHRYSTEMDNFTKAQNSKTKVGKRCYRLNLERPFDIHCEQSPLEYGDYMAPWTKEVYPSTVGPTEYCPPRHLGGERVVWRELMRWSAAADRASAENDHRDDDEEGKVNSLDEVEQTVEGKMADLNVNSDEATSLRGSSLASGVLSPGGGVYLTSGDEEIEIANEEKVGSSDELNSGLDATEGQTATTAPKGNPASPTGGWRTLTSTEISDVQKLGELNDQGEYAFETYDMSHLVLNTAKDLLRDGNDNIVHIEGVSDFPGAGLDGAPLRTVFSMDSNTSEEEQLNPKSPEDMANDTARLFRRSELSLREKAELEAAAEAEKEEQRRKQDLERMERERETGLLSDDSPLDRSSRGKKKSRGRRFSSGGKAIMRGVSKAFSDLSGTPSSNSSNFDSSWRASSQRRSNSSASGQDGRPSTARRSSMQALTIDKARDLVDESDDEGSVVDAVEGDEGEEKKKPLNVSLFILGEYDVLNDLTNDGAKRLRANREESDVNLLLQNDPCPPPNRWVRSTGWGKCNPSSNYAKFPPEDFDWIKYYDKLRLRRDEYKDTPEDPSDAGPNSCEAAKIATTLPQVKTAPTEPITPRGQTDFLSSSAKTPRSKSGSASRTSGVDNLSQSAGTPHSRTGNGGAKSQFNTNSDSLSQSARTSRSGKRGGFGRRMSSMLRGKQ